MNKENKDTPRRRLGLEILQLQEASQYLEIDQIRDWDKRLKRPRPLAQSWLENRGLLTDEVYTANEAAMNDFEVGIVESVLRDIGSPGGIVYHIGVGVGEDLDYWPVAERLGFQILAADHSEVALNQVPQDLPPDLLHQAQLDILDVVENFLTEESRSLVYAGRVIHHIPDTDKVHRVLWCLGRFLRVKSRKNRVLIIDPFLDENPQTKWVDLPAVAWRSELVERTELGAERKLKVVELGQVTVYPELNPKVHVALEFR